MTDGMPREEEDDGRAATVADLVAFLQSLDQAIPLHRDQGIGDHTAIGTRDFPTLYVPKTLMTFRGPDGDFHADQSDPVWKSERTRFGPGFKALVLG